MDIIISLNKPKDITSQAAVTKVKRILNVKKAGHTGTLDPMATGLMLICINKATRLAPYFSDRDKEYKAVMKLGEATDTQDACGNVISRCDRIEVTEESIRAALESFQGTISQRPPMYSALKHKGKSLYKYAREGIEIERKSREITIHNIKLLEINLPFIKFVTSCSKGTYIRTLCNDIGEKLGTWAHLSELERISVGQYRIEDSLTFEELLTIIKGDQIEKGIYTMDEVLSWMPEFKINDSLLKSVIHGNPIKLNLRTQLPDHLKSATGIRIKSPDGDLLAIGSYIPVNDMIKMNIVFS